MAIGRLSVKVGKAGKAGPHAAYIAREGKYANRLENGEKLEAKESGNMPDWARDHPQEFWKAADEYERKNGTTYREMEIALPRELSPDQRRDLVREFVQQEIGDRHAYQWAIHTPKAIDGGEQPHVHLMFSERQLDGISRDPDQYFKRYNSKAPENGGAQKGYGSRAGETLTAIERKAEIKDLRTRWQDMTNRHLERSGVEARIDMRSHAERQTGIDPERKQLPSEWNNPAKRAQVIEFRLARTEQVSARENLKREIPDAGAEIISLQAERDRRALPEKRAAGLSGLIEQLRDKTKDVSPLVSPAGIKQPSVHELLAKRGIDPLKKPEAVKQPTVHELLAKRGIDPMNTPKAVKQPTVHELLAKQGIDPSKKLEAGREPTVAEQIAVRERKRLERMTPVELRAEAAKIRPEPLEDAVKKSPEVIEATERREALASVGRSALAQREQATKEVEQWRKDHTFKTMAHDSGLKPSEYLNSRAEVIERANQTHQATQPSFEKVSAERERLMDEARKRLSLEQREAREQAYALEKRAEAQELQHATDVVERRRESHGPERDDDMELEL